MVKGREEVDVEVIQTYVQETLDRLFADKEASVGPETMRMLEKHIMLNVVDQNWKEHLARMDYLRQGRSEEHTSELQSLMRSSYADFCLKTKTKKTQTNC